MRTRKILAATGTAIALTVGGFTLGHSNSASAAGTTISTSSSTKVMLNSRCYELYSTTVTPYYHSSKYGWVKYPSPKVTSTKSEHCYTTG